MSSTENIVALKDLYKSYFKIGVACERINGKFTNHEIGNPDKEKLMHSQFNSITFGNELKPAYNMGYESPEATEEYLPFVISTSAKAMLDWAKENGMPVRGHVMVWHSQCPKEVFCKDYKSVTIPTDPEILKERPMMKFFEKLDPICYVDRQTMLKRLKSYIFSLVEYMFANDYANTIYAWDVVNEAIELDDKTETGLRNSYWYQIIGDDFIYWAFRFAKDAVVEVSKKYAAAYGVSADDEEALQKLQPKLFYNDYNEWQPAKRAAIIGTLTHTTNEHGSVIGEGLIDGIGMQGHLSDNSNIEEYITALREYAALVNEVHITELDVKCTCINQNAEYYQAVFYKKFFEALLAVRREGVNLSSVTLWGLTDDNSWIRDANPLLFHGDLSPKRSFDALVYAITKESLGEPEKLICDLSDRLFDFETPAGGEPLKPEDIGFKMKGFGEIEIQDRIVHSGNAALANERRFGAWSGISFDVSDFIGQTISVSTWVKSPALTVTLNADVDGTNPELTSVETGSTEWVQMSAVYKVPSDVHSMSLYFGTTENTPDTFSAVYVDDVEIRLIGLFESFEEKSNIAAIRGAGHLPICFVTDTESRDGKGHSFCVTRQEKDATMKFNVSPYIGRKVDITVYVKTKDKIVKIGLDGAVPRQLSEIATCANEWTKISASVELPNDLNSAEIYIETDGNADFYVDDIFVCPARS
ncbi:MAG TPA: endo-1,4-beta-xylanase [Lachnospiraceae bacterium]|nr:endo-1,4-beta-xylanase [Lachnospiraceae bacterium]